MSKVSLNKGWVSQKLETRNTILQTTRELLARGQDVSLESIARAAGISRATIYRYFSDVEVLVTEASLDIHHRSPEELADEVSDLPLEDSLLRIQEYYNQLALEKEPVFRRYLSAVLKASVNSDRTFRGARRIKALDAAMEPFEKEFSPGDLHKLRNISALLMGIDPMVTAKDVVGLNNQESLALTRWALEMILKGMKAE